MENVTKFHEKKMSWHFLNSTTFGAKPVTIRMVIGHTEYPRHKGPFTYAFHNFWMSQSFCMKFSLMVVYYAFHAFNSTIGTIRMVTNACWKGSNHGFCNLTIKLSKEQRFFFILAVQTMYIERIMFKITAF